MQWRSKQPLDLMASVARYKRWGDDPVCLVEDGTMWRAFMAGDTVVAYSARQDPDGSVEIQATDNDLALADFTWRLSESLPRADIEDLAQRDGVVGKAYSVRPGYRPPLEPDPFVSLITSVTAQQVNLRWAVTTRTRIVHAYAEPFEFGGKQLWPFPQPGTLAKAAVSELRDLQLTTRKSEYIVGIAQTVADGAVDDLSSMPNEAVIDRLTAIRGVGRWTADWLLARCLGRPEVVAAGDLGVRKAISHIYRGDDALQSEAEVRTVTERWGSAANWATHLLLEELATQ